MAAPSYTYTLANSTTADADEVMQNFNDILNGVSDGTKDLSINALTVAGAATFNGNVQLGNATGDTVSYTARVASDIVPSTSAARNLGSSSLAWIGLYLDNGATDGGAVYFDASSSKFLKANAAGTEMELSGFTTLDTNGAQQKEMALYAETKTNTDYTITDTDGLSTIFVSTGSTTRTMTLPTLADNVGRVIEIIKIDSGSGDVTIDGEGAETINGATTQTLSGQYDKIKLIAGSSQWLILGEPTATSARPGVVRRYQKEDVDLSTDASFTAGTLQCLRIGDFVSLTLTARVTHSSSSALNSSSGLIPAAYRPADFTVNVGQFNSTFLTKMGIDETGALYFEYATWAGASSAQTGSPSGTQLTLSYSV